VFIDPTAILFGIVLVVVLLVVGTRFFPDDMHLDPWRYEDPPNRPSGQEDDDAKFHWDETGPKTSPRRDR